MAEYAKLQ